MAKVIEIDVHLGGVLIKINTSRIASELGNKVAYKLFNDSGIVRVSLDDNFTCVEHVNGVNFRIIPEVKGSVTAVTLPNQSASSDLESILKVFSVIEDLCTKCRDSKEEADDASRETEAAEEAAIRMLQTELVSKFM